MKDNEFYQNYPCTLYYEKQKREVEYLRCLECKNSNKVLCGRSLMDKEKCVSYHKQKICIFNIWANSQFIPKDIIQVISIFYQGQCCIH